jgi:hypothetical protein
MPIPRNLWMLQKPIRSGTTAGSALSFEIQGAASRPTVCNGFETESFCHTFFVEVNNS